MIHFVYRIPQYKNYLGKIFEKIAFTVGLPEGIPTPWRYGKLLAYRYPKRHPHSLTFNLLKELKKRDSVRFYDMYENTVCNMKAGDVFLGMPIQAYDGRSWDDPSLHRVTLKTLEKYGKDERMNTFIIMPYTHDERYNQATSEIIKRYGQNLIILSGKIWTDTWDQSSVKDYAKNLLRVNMGINPDEYPVVKKSFNPKGKRKYLYIGHTGYYKNTAQLEAIAAAIPGFEGGHIGLGKVKGWKQLSDFADLTPEFMSKIAEEYDIFVNTSTADASPATVLEHMCMGFAVACTPESSYDYDSITRLHVTDTAFNVQALNELQYADESDLIERSKRNRAYAMKYHNWQEICKKIADFIEEHTKRI